MHPVRSTLLGSAAAVMLALGGAGGAAAHNAAHHYLPDGTCREVGSIKEAPYIGPQGAKVQLDLVPETVGRDEYGARYAANHSPTLLPGECPD
jgi:hypothetical protein